VIVVVTGGRDYADRDALFDALYEIHDLGTPITLIRNGGMTGADALSSRWAYEAGVDTECIGALWGTHGRSAGPKRNAAMLARPTNLVLAAPGGRGTASAVGLARGMGLTVREVPW